MTEATYLEAGGTPVFAMYDAAAPDCAPGTGVLLCPPLGWQDVSSYRPRRQWALTLSAAGHPTLRIDLPGTGDSGGGPRDPARVAAWAAALSAAGAGLREVSGCRRLAAVGFGLSGLLVLSALAEGAQFDEIVLWGTGGRGAALVREFRAFSRLQKTGPDIIGVPEGGMLTAGFLMTRETIDALRALDAATLAGLHGVERALLLERDGLPVDPYLRTALADAGVSVDCAPGEGFAEMLAAEPHDAVPADATLARIIGWLQHPTEPTGTRAARLPKPATRPDMRAEAEISTDGNPPLRETPLWLECREGRLFGILSEPVEGEPEVCAILLNAGAQRRIGVNRMWVEIARRWTVRGVPCLRLDVAAIGDSDGDAQGFADSASFYVPEFVTQIRMAMDALVRRGLPARFVLLGLCSGAYWSYQTALEDERVRVALMINPRALEWDVHHRELYALSPHRRWRRAVADRTAWRRLASSGARRWLRLCGSLVRDTLRPLGRGANPQEVQRARDALARRLDRGFDVLRDRGQHAMLLFSADEPLAEQFAREGRFATPERWPNVVMPADPLLREGTSENHTLRPLWLQRAVHEHLDQALEGELQRSRVPAAGR